MGILNLMDITLSTPNKDDKYHSMKYLVDVAQELSHCRNIDAITEIVRKAARDLTGADGATFVLRDEDKCYYIDEYAMAPLWKGQKFPMELCISGWVMQNAHPVIIPDVYQDARIPADVYRKTFVQSMTMVPIRKHNSIGAIGNYWAYNHHSTADELSLLEALANITSIAIENSLLYSHLQDHIKALEGSNNELKRFAWSVSHDLKPSLKTINNLSHWAEAGIKEERQQDSFEHLKLMRSKIDNMEKLLGDMHDYTMQDKTNAQDLIEDTAYGIDILESINEQILIPSGFQIITKGGFNDLPMSRMPLQQIFSNLVKNAIEHHHNISGTVTIEAEIGEKFYTFRVTDDGPGIHFLNRQKISSIFTSDTSIDLSQGPRFGLKIVKRILDAYGGQIKLHSPPEGGSCFIFTWPRSAIA